MTKGKVLLIILCTIVMGVAIYLEFNHGNIFSIIERNDYESFQKRMEKGIDWKKINMSHVFTAIKNDNEQMSCDIIQNIRYVRFDKYNLNKILDCGFQKVQQCYFKRFTLKNRYSDGMIDLFLSSDLKRIEVLLQNIKKTDLTFVVNSSEIAQQESAKNIGLNLKYSEYKDYFKDVPVPVMYTKSKKIKGGNYLARPANKNRNSTLTVTPMMIAALTNNVGYIKLLMKYGAKTSYDLKNFKYKRLRQNPVDIATDKKVIALLKMSGKSYSPIQKAVLSNNSELFSRVYPPKLTRKEKDRIFKFAINEGSDQIVKLLVEKFKYKLNRNDTNLLFAVFKSNNKDILEYLLSKKMGLGVKIDKYKLPRDIRYVNYKSKYLKYSSKSRKERYSKTNKFYILDVLYKKSLEMKNYKMAAMIDMYRSSWGKLHSLVVSGNMIEFKALLNEKPKLKDLKDNRGRTPLSLAVYYYREAALRELLQKGANPDIEDSEGKTPLMVCAENGKNEMIKILLNSGASLRNSKYSKCAVAASIAINNHKRLNRLAMIFRATASRYKNNSILNRFPYIKNAEHYKITAGLLRDAAAKRKVKGCKGFY